MTLTDIAIQRMHNQFLLKPLARPQDVVRKLGAVQSQDFPGGKWAVGQRSQNATDESITKLFNDGKILRTHILRPTWHFVSPEDIRWMQMLTAPRVQAFNKYYYRKVDLDDATLRKSADVLAHALTGGKQLTRKEIQTVWQEAGINTDGLRLGHMLMFAELEAVVCSGAMQGKQHTLALISDRAPQAKTLTQKEALKELTTRFFTSHGPATIKDFAWWSSLTVADIKAGIELAGLKSVEVEGAVFYFARKAPNTIPSPTLHLLPNYDEYLIAYQERRPVMATHFDTQPATNDWFYHFIVLDGKLVGAWKRINTTKSVTIQPKLFKNLTAEQEKKLGVAATELQKFLAIPVHIS